ncbi:MAG TPA: hypothetical protein VFE62_25390 [Gemmataceae bacterium]|nr:hypothetical protein [Gemmataceae bacterium]
MQVSLTDQWGNPVTNQPISFNVPTRGASGTFNANSVVMTDANGLASAPGLTANHVAGKFTMTAQLLNSALIATRTLTNTPMPTSIQVYSGSGQKVVVNQQIAAPLQVVVTGIGGMPLGGIPVTFEFSDGDDGPGGSFAGSATVYTNAVGIATAASLVANTKAGNFNVTAWADGLATPALFNLAVLPGSVATLSVAEDHLRAQVTKPFSNPSIYAMDQYDNPIPNVAIAFTIQPNAATGASAAFAGGGTRYTGITAPSVSGVARPSSFATLTANAHAGDFTLLATAANKSVTLTINLTNLPGPPAALSIVAGNNQTATVGNAFAAPFVVKVTDAYQNALSGVQVLFANPTAGAGPSGAFANTTAVTTDDNGIATAPTFTANTAAGTYSVKATIAGVASAVATFNVTNTADKPAHLTAVVSTQSTVNGVFAKPLQVTVTDIYNNPVDGAYVIFQIPNPPPVLQVASATFPVPQDSGKSGPPNAGKSATVPTSKGVATSPLLISNRIKGTFTVTASIFGIVETARFTLTIV